MEPFIGIDLGTTNCCVATVEGGVPTVIPNRGGYKTTPSMFAVAENGRRLVGHLAKRQAITNAANTVYAAKRLIGRKWLHPAVQQARESLPYRLVPGTNGDVQIVLRDRRYPLTEISALVLGEMKRVAEEYFGEPVTKAVITIPAYFNDGQRQATKDAGRIAGLDVLRIINEPTAAALAYGFKRRVRKRIAVYDLGGGTFDISILDIQDGVFEVLATAGDTFLGGEDFDTRIVEWLVISFQKEHGLDLRADPMAMQRLRDAAEKAKIDLSMTTSTDINLPFIISSGPSDALHLQRTLTRDKLEEMTSDFVSQTLHLCDRMMSEAKIEKEQIEEVVLVGGQTRMPRVQKAVREFFGIEPAKTVHPDEVVALGAAIQAAALVNQSKEGEADILLLDVTPLDLGIMVAGGYFKTLIPANTTVPTSASHVFTTVRDEQTAVKIVVMQGKSARALDNELLGEFLLPGLPKKARGTIEIDVSFDISADGIVSVSARDRATGSEQGIEVTATHRLSDHDIKRIIAEHEAEVVTQKSEGAFAALRTDVERLVRDLERLMPLVRNVVIKSEIGQTTLEKTTAIVDRARHAITLHDQAALEELRAALDRSVQVFRAVHERGGK